MKKKNRIIMVLLAITIAFTSATTIALMDDDVTITAEAASKISLSTTKKTIGYKQSFNLSIKNTGSKTVKWSTSNKKIAKITKVSKTKYKVTGVKPGTATIKAKVGGKTYKCKVTVSKISRKTKTIYTGDSFNLSLNGVSGNVKWSTSNKKIASIKKVSNKKYKVTGKKKGTATITAKVNGKKYKCKVTVNKAGLISASSTSVSMKDTGSKKIKITLTGASSRDADLKYKIGNTDVVSCSWGNWSGDTIPLTITGENAGSTSIKITNSISSKTCTIKVTVNSSVTISMPSTPVTINQYSSSGAIRRTFNVTKAYYSVEKSGSSYYYKIYIDGTKTYDSSGDNVSSNCYVDYKLYNNSNGTVVESGTLVTPALATGESCEGAYTNGFLDAGDYKLVLLDRL